MLLTAVLVVLGGFGVVSPAVAASNPDDVVLSFNSDPNAGLGVSDPTEQTTTAQLLEHTRSRIEVWGERDGLQLTFFGSAAHPLAPGVYTGVDEGWTSGRVGFAFTLNGRGFNAADGEVDVLDLAVDPDGTVSRFDVLFVSDRTTPFISAWGEVRWHEPDPAGLTATARALQWPTVGVGRTPVAARDAIVNRSGQPVRVGTSRVSGPAAADFRLTADACSGTTLPVGGSCILGLTYRPTRPGPRVATLTVASSAGALQVGLAGSVQLGTSSVVSSGADIIDAGHRRTTTAVTAYVRTQHGRPSFLFGLDPDSAAAKTDDLDRQMQLVLQSPTRTPAHGTHTLGKGGWGLAYTYGYRSCDAAPGTVTVHGFTVDGDGRPSFADVDFRLACTADHHTHTLTGRLRYQSRTDRTAPTSPTRLQANGAKVTWRSSGSTDRAVTIIRAVPGSSGASPLSGIPVFAGTGTRAELPALPAGTWRLVAYTVDTTGNISAPTVLHLN